MKENAETAIRRLARELESVHARSRAMRAMNTPQDAEGRAMLAEELAMAEAESMKLSRNLMLAQNRYAEGR